MIANLRTLYEASAPEQRVLFLRYRRITTPRRSSSGGLPSLEWSFLGAYRSGAIVSKSTFTVSRGRQYSQIVRIGSSAQRNVSFHYEYESSTRSRLPPICVDESWSTSVVHLQHPLHEALELRLLEDVSARKAQRWMVRAIAPRAQDSLLSEDGPAQSELVTLLKILQSVRS